MGSLFKLRDLWYTKYGDEEFDCRSMAVGNVDNETPASDKIVVGSFEGVLRVLHPKRKGFQPDDVLLEVNIGQPILQVAVGAFTPSVRGVSIAILTPRKLLVGSVTRVRGSGSVGATGVGAEIGGTDLFSKQCEFKREYEHFLERTAFNFCFGAFGGSNTGTDQIAVQSMDGQIAIFDHNKHIFSRFLPSTSFLCPGCFEYVKTKDAFIVSASTFELELYRFSNLASSTASETKEHAQGRKLTPDWRFNMGADATSISVCNFSAKIGEGHADIVVVTEHSIVCLSDDGDMKWNRRVDYFPSCALAYQPGEQGKGKKGASAPSHLLVGTHGQSIIVMDRSEVLWSARGGAVPLALAIVTANGVDGMIAMLGDDGSLSVNYLGTDPANNPVQVLESKELDYDAMDEENKRLRIAIQQAVNHGRTEPRDQLHVSVDSSQPVAADRVANVVIRLSYRGTEDLENLVVSVTCQDPLMATVHTVHVPYLAQGAPHEVPVRFVVNPAQERFTPVSLLCEAVVCYSTANDEPIATKQTFLIPLGVVGAPIEPVKNTRYAISVAINRDQAVPVNVLFDDLAQRSSQVSTNVLSFQYCSGADATVIASSKGGRYKVQSSTFEALWLLTSELVRRLKQHFRGQADLAFEFSDPIPMAEYFDVIDRHFAARMNLQQSHQQLAELAQQFRAVQKRLLVRFRERNPTPLSSLEALFEETYRMLHEKAEEVSKLQFELEGHSNALSCATQIVLLITRYKLQDVMTADDFDAFRYFLSPSVHVNSTQGWEEATDAGMTYLLRTVLARNARESATAPQPLVIPTDTEKLKRHITLVFDRMSKGQGSIAEAVQGAKTKEEVAAKAGQFQVTEKRA